MSERRPTRLVLERRRQLRMAAVAGAALLLITVAVFSGFDGVGGSFELRARFTSANNVHPGNPVRIAGVDVGEVSSVSPGPDDTSILTMKLDRELRIHADATLAIEPRLILEGNYYINLEPGSPGTSLLRDGSMVPMAATSVPVQLDQVLGTFDAPTRHALQDTIHGIGAGLGAGDSATVTEASAPAGYQGLRDAAKELRSALPPTARAARRLQGSGPGDLSLAVRSSRDVAAQLAQDPDALADIVSNFDAVMGTLSDEGDALGKSLVQLDRLAVAAPASLTALDRALPMVTTFARRLTPVLRRAPGPLRKTTALALAVKSLVRPAVLPAALRQLGPITAALPPLESSLRRLLPQVIRIDQCLTQNVIPTLNQKVPDGKLSTGDPAWLEALHMSTGITSVDGGFDGNGVAARGGVAVGGATLSGTLPGVGRIVGIGADMKGVQPTWLGSGVTTPFRPDEWCDQQPLPDLTVRSGPPPAYLAPAPPAKRKRGR